MIDLVVGGRGVSGSFASRPTDVTHAVIFDTYLTSAFAAYFLLPSRDWRVAVVSDIECCMSQTHILQLW